MVRMPSRVIYLDHQATSPCRAEVIAAMEPWWREHAANPSSRLHRPGVQAAAALELARQRMSTGLGASAGRLVFTSGATEANNLALKGLAEAELEAGGKRRHLVTLCTEHRAVLDPLRHLARYGFELTELPVQANGLVDLSQLEAALRDDTLLVSVMAAHNEIGVIQPIAAIANLCRARAVTLHCDAAQAAGHLPLDVQDLGVQLLSLSAHKLGGPMGIGALWVAEGIRIAPQLHGGDQEWGWRAGTPALPFIIGFQKALELALQEQPERLHQLAALRDALWRGIRDLGGIACNGATAPRLAHNLNIWVDGVDGVELHRQLRQRLAVSGGSACSNGKPSHVLQALGLSRQQAAAAVRFSLGPDSTAEDIENATRVFRATVEQLRT
jgi:cysteine desulfurase